MAFWNFGCSFSAGLFCPDVLAHPAAKALTIAITVMFFFNFIFRLRFFPSQLRSMTLYLSLFSGSRHGIERQRTGNRTLFFKILPRRVKGVNPRNRPSELRVKHRLELSALKGDFHVERLIESYETAAHLHIGESGIAMKTIAITGPRRMGDRIRYCTSPRFDQEV